MANLIINVRCTCEEEFLLLHKLHKLYQEDQLRKRLRDRLVFVQGNGDGTKSYTVKCEEPENVYDEKPLPAELERTRLARNADGLNLHLQAVDGGVDALGNPPLPESATSISEFAIGDRAEEFHYEEEPVPDQMWKGGKEDYSFRPESVKAKPEITLTDVLEAEALENAERLDA